MRINANLALPVTIDTETLDWVPSPAPGVDRKMLYREGEEVARATSLVRYAPGSAFPEHTHAGGEEILVLGGTFQDEHGDYPAGCYFRNPPGTAHSPASKDGCALLVRLWQFRAGDTQQIVRPPENVLGPRVLFDDGAERVTLERRDPHIPIILDNARGLELMVLSGALRLEGQTLGPQAWLRRPAGQGITARSGADGVTFWLKDAPLQHDDVLTIPE
ncbi:quercetin dioxygenase-like cupin family protein [Sagittula marina]|uniref:Quercetin dioxygenase-like cupin family protein n=1 Tax=Sagittula marina TaxID=943940 RepID=A0A7W6DTQ0_9RHOB|nr:cupin domain-containing protein [Sagittula marina]MBB3985888.1 quercetin dioxygenase-like cupin family protein [Sagittula marina]